MRLLHTSDWHIGRTLSQESLLEDQAQLADQVFEVLKESRAEALIISGDIFDRPNPRREAIGLFSDFLRRVYLDTGAAIVVLAGNHDAPERISFGSALHDPRRVLFRGPLSDGPEPLVLEDRHGKVAISALPFSEIFAAREAFGAPDLASPADVLRAQIAEAHRCVPTGARWVVCAHGFIDGARSTDSERPLAQIGGLETVPARTFDQAAYVALGHLHRPQSVGTSQIRYSGSWMGFGFDEAGEEKSLSLVELDAKGAVAIEAVALSPRRPLRIVTGHLADLLEQGRTEPDPQRNALVKAVVTDECALVDAMGQLRQVYPFVLQLERRRTGNADPNEAPVASADRRDPEMMIASFLQSVTGDAPSETESELINATLAEVRFEEEAA